MAVGPSVDPQVRPVADKKVGVLGSGDVGRALAAGFARHGYDVLIGTRDASKLAEWRAATKGTVSVGGPAEAAGHGSIVVVATNGAGTIPAIELAGVERFKGKLVIDVTNPLDFSRGMPPGLSVGTTDSLGEQVQRKLPDAHVVKCFNTVGNSKMVDPVFREGTPKMLICGNDARSKARVDALLKEFGWPGALDVGGIEGARWLEALVPLWVRVGAAEGTFEHAFKVVR